MHGGNDFGGGQCAGGEKVLHAVRGEHPSVGRDRAGCRGHHAVGQQIRVANTAGVQQLGVDAAAGGVNGSRDGAPRPHLLDGVQSRRVRIALADHAGLDTFGDDQPRRRALRVVPRHQRGGQSGPGRSAPGHRGHDDAVWQPQAPDLDRVERRDVMLQRKIQWPRHECHTAAADAAG
jgi:hypothetical protein